MSTTSLNYIQIVSSLIDNRKNIKPKRAKIGKKSHGLGKLNQPLFPHSHNLFGPWDDEGFNEKWI